MTQTEARPHATEVAPLPLAGIRVLDLSRVLSGPYCALLLSELGAEVIKVEKPGRGDHSRRDRGGPLKGTSMQFVAVNAGKKSITLDTWKPEGVAIFKDLVGQSDVVLENFRPGVMDDMGIGYDVLSEINPRLVMTSISGWGAGNSLSRYAAHAGVITAFSGAMMFDPEGKTRPKRAGGAGGSPDTISGIQAALGTVAALAGRASSGRGRHVDISMASAVIGQSAVRLISDLIAGPSSQRTPGDDGTFVAAFHDTYKAKDGWIYVQADLAGEWKSLANAIGRPEMVTDPRFIDERARSANKPVLDEIFTAWTSSKTMEEIFRQLGPLGVPCSPAHTGEDVAFHPYMRERGMIQEVDDPRAGRKIPLIGPRIRFDGDQAVPPAPPSALGEHNAEILGGLLGYDKAKIEALKASEVI